MPFLYILLPESFVSRFPRAQTILSINTKALTSAHDLYHTMRHIDQLSRSPADRKGLPEYSAVVPNKYPTISSESRYEELWHERTQNADFGGVVQRVVRTKLVRNSFFSEKLQDGWYTA